MVSAFASSCLNVLEWELTKLRPTGESVSMRTGGGGLAENKVLLGLRFEQHASREAARLSDSVR